MTENTVSAGQIIYTRVEPEYSPIGKSGFQTVYHTAGLQPSTVEQVERRIQCFQPYDHDTVRVQFFRLSNDVLVLSRSRTIIPRPEIWPIVDKIGRTGAFLAHCLLLSVDGLRLLGGSPLNILADDVFVEDVQDMVARFGKASETQYVSGRPNGQILPATLKPTSTVGSVGTEWEGEEARRLLSLALQADSIVRQGKSLAIAGSQAQIWTALQTALALVPFDQRLLCTFDTCIDQCVVTPGQYWAVGVRERVGDTKYIDVNAARRQVSGGGSLAAAPDDMYGLWLDEVTQRDSFREAMKHSRTVQFIARAFSRRNPVPREAAADEAGCVEFLRVHQDRVDQAIRETILEELGNQTLADLVGDSVFAVINGPIAQLSIASTRTFPKGELAKHLYTRLVSEECNLSESDWKYIQSYAQREGQYPLLFAAATLGKTINLELAGLAVDSMSAQSFRALCLDLGERLEPALFVAPLHAEHLVDILVSHDVELSSDEAFSLFDALIKARQAKVLTPLIHFVDILTPAARRRLEKLIARHPVPEEFRWRLEQVSVENRSPTLFRRLFRRK